MIIQPNLDKWNLEGREPPRRSQKRSDLSGYINQGDWKLGSSCGSSTYTALHIRPFSIPRMDVLLP